MSVKCSEFYDDVDGDHWHVWHNPMRQKAGVFVDVNRPQGREDEWGYADLEVTPWQELPDGTLAGADVRLFLPRAVCEGIAKWVADEKRREEREKVK